MVNSLCVSREIPVPLLPCEDLLAASQPSRIRAQSAPAIFGCDVCAWRKTGFQHGDYGYDDNYHQELSLIHCTLPVPRQCVLWDASAGRVLFKRFLQLWRPQVVCLDTVDAIGSFHQTYSAVTRAS